MSLCRFIISYVLFVVQACLSSVLDAWIEIFLANVHFTLSSAAYKYQQNRHFWERQELNPGLLDEKPECYLCAMQPHF